MSDTITVKAYAALEAKQPLVPFEFTVGAPQGDNVLIRVEYCGVCHSDMSMANNDWGISQFPLVPGHEAVGIVEAVGPLVKKVQVGSRVGVGWHAGYCGSCQFCHSGDENLCAQGEPTIVGHHGGFADRLVARERAVISIPAGCNPATVGPLLCGGITVFTPLTEYGIQATDHIGVVGIGGLGHIALRFLKAMGCEVTAFSSSLAKADFAKQLGATHVVDSTKPEEINKLAGTFKMILITANVNLDWAAYLNALAPRGRLHFVGITPPLTIPSFPLLMGMKQVSASPSGNARNMQKMLEFCARHKVEPMVEEFSLSQVNEVFEKIHSNKIRFRAVVKL